jgi:thiamine-phosphate pyrophosphorylase
MQPRSPLDTAGMKRELTSAEQIDLARIMDASVNRAREALRVIEDYCRFALDDAFLSGKLKNLRHELAESLACCQHLLEGRETERDVGTNLTAPGEQNRPSPLAVVEANCKRLQEALRTLEEFGKIQYPDVGSAMEKLRYRSYTLEKVLVLGAQARERLAEVRLCVLVSGSDIGEASRASIDDGERGCVSAPRLEWLIKEAAAGGAGMIQLREKNASDRDLLEQARQVRHWTREAGVLFVVNDRPDIARLAEADGVHLGQDDLPVKEARRIVGPDFLIGVSTHNLAQVRQAILDGASYIGVGPTFPSGTKEFGEFPGLEFVGQVMKETKLPAFVIGGVSQENIEQIAAAGARRMAVSQAIYQASDPRRAVEELLKVLYPAP